jgi:hypothetical protein
MRSLGDFLLLAFGVLVCGEIFIRLPLAPLLERLRRIVARLATRLQSPVVSDQWKAIAARRSAIKIISLTSLLLIFITTAIFPIVLVSWLIVGSFYGVPDFLLEADVIIVLTIFALPYVIRVLRVRVRG